MNEITASADTLMRQAPATAALYLREAIVEIDQQFGEGYAKEHPDLVAAFLQTCAIDMATSTIGATIQETARAIGEIATAMEDRP